MSNESYSVYPTFLDGYNTLPLRKDGIHEIVAADVNRLRDAIVKIEQELGVQPSGTYATVSSRLDNIGDASVAILAHISATSGAHAASAISILDTEDNYFGADVESALEELSVLLPPQPDTVGTDSSTTPNSGISNIYDGYGTRFAFNLSSSDSIHKKTQPSTLTGIRGIHIIDISNNTENGTGTLKITGGIGSELLYWKAPGDPSYGDAVSIASLSEGEEAILLSFDTSKKIRVARNSLPLAYAGSGIEESFEVNITEFVSGYYSLPAEGFRQTNYITRTAKSITDISRLQAMLGGMVFPADRGTLVLQRKLRGYPSFVPVAILDLSANFDETYRSTGQKTYVPSMDDYDTITLYDRYPSKADYSSILDASGQPIFQDFEKSLSKFQVARYNIPMSNGDIVGGTLSSPSNTTLTEIDDKVSAYRILHVKEGVTNFNGDVAASNLYSVYDSSTSTDNSDNTVKFANVYVDSDTSTTQIETVNLSPVAPAPILDLTTMRSGIKYYNGSSDLFDFVMRSNNYVFNKTYLVNNVLSLDSNAFYFPSGFSDGYWGQEIDLQELTDDGYLKWSNSNLPEFTDQTYYVVDNFTLIDGVDTNEDRRLYPDSNKFSNHAYLSAILHGSFNDSDAYVAYGAGEINRILVNSYSITRATASTEYFTDESRRIDETVTFDAVVDGHVWGTFDNQSPLPYYSLQVGGRFDEDYDVGGLVYPQQDYYAYRDIIRPLQQNSALLDYSARSGDSSYQRLFSLGYPIGSGKLRVVSGGDYPISFEDIMHDNINRFGKIEVKVPGPGNNSTGWLDIGRLFKTGLFSDSDGALYGEVTGSIGDFTVPFIFGPNNTAEVYNYNLSEKDYSIAVRVTYFGETAAQRETSREKIITMIQLLP